MHEILFSVFIQSIFNVDVELSDESHLVCGVHVPKYISAAYPDSVIYSFNVVNTAEIFSIVFYDDLVLLTNRNGRVLSSISYLAASKSMALLELLIKSALSEEELLNIILLNQ